MGSESISTTRAVVLWLSITGHSGIDTRIFMPLMIAIMAGRHRRFGKVIDSE